MTTPTHGVRVVMFPSAGGSGSVARRWRAHADLESVRFEPVNVRRMRSQLCEPTVEALAATAASELEIDAHTVVVGHSLGGTLAVETLRLLAGAGAALPAALVVMASRPPSQPVGPAFAAAVRRDDGALLDEVVGLGALDAGLVRRTAGPPPGMSSLRADLEMLVRYRPDPAGWTPLDVPAEVWTGRHDPLVRPASASGWRPFFSGWFHHRTFDGGHQFPADDARSVAPRLRGLIETFAVDRRAPTLANA